jgi:hypothetical protein
VYVPLNHTTPGFVTINGYADVSCDTSAALVVWSGTYLETIESMNGVSLEKHVTHITLLLATKESALDNFEVVEYALEHILKIHPA